MKRQSFPQLAIGAFVGAIAAAALLPVGFVTGSGDFWLRPNGDVTQYLTTWEFFVHDRWRFPLLLLPAMGYPEGGSVLFTDALPAAQLLSKVAYSVSGVAINPFGWWILLCYILQGAFAVRVVRAAGVHSPLASAAAAVLAVACDPFISRMWHIALASHFLLLWALALYLENVRDRRFTAGEHFALSALALLVNAYLFVMVGALQVAAVVALWSRAALAKPDWQRAASLIVGVAAIGLVLGYGAVASGSSSMRATGFGVFSWNLVTLFVPPEMYWGNPLGVVRDATSGQREGEAYLGLGAVMLAVACLLTSARPMALAMRRHWSLVAALLLFAAYAASHRVFLGSTLLLDLPIPPPLLDVAGYFRAGGRFIWVPVYAIGLLSLAGLFRWRRPMFVVPLVLVAVILQTREASVLVKFMRPQLTAASMPELLDRVQMAGWMQRHRGLFQFPSLSCGGLWDRTDANRTLQSWRELQIQLLAAKSSLPINTMYTSRQLKDCGLEARWALEANMVPDVLYLLNKVDVPRTERLAALARSNACIDVEWAYACSTQDLKAASPGGPADGSLATPRHDW